MPNEPAIDLLCPAKVNLALSVGAPNSGGLHPLASWMVAVSLHDRLSVKRSVDRRCSFDIAFADGELGGPICTVDWPVESDLAVRSVRLLEERCGRRLPVSLTLKKQIRPRGGLGGGSSDAAGTLIAVNALFDLGLSLDELCGLGARLGSDVPFLVRAIGGEPSCLVSGLGEECDSVPLAKRLFLTLIFPSIDCPTCEVYAAFDRLHGTGAGRNADAERVRRLAGGPALDPARLFNDLAQPACMVQPQLATLISEVEDHLGATVHVTGSGSTVFVVAESEDASRDLAERTRSKFRLPALAVHTV